MFQLDDKFLQDVGLGGLPEDQKKLFHFEGFEILPLRLWQYFQNHWRPGPLNGKLSCFVSSLVILLQDEWDLGWIDISINVIIYQHDRTDSTHTQATRGEESP